MKDPVDIVRGKIVDISEYGVVTIKAKYDDFGTFIKRGYRDCNIQMLDSRPLSDKQRRACYALLHVISDYTGMGIELTKEQMKLKFVIEDLQQTADKLFSLSNGGMSLVCAFQRFLVRIIIDWEIPCDFPLLKYVDDVGDYVYACLEKKVCCVCGKPADLHHSEHAVGMGRNREEIIHEGMKVLPLCRVHHTEAHTMGKKDFIEKYHLIDGIVLDKNLCKKYKLKSKKSEIEIEKTENQI